MTGLDPTGELGGPGDGPPLRRFRYPDGHLGWVVARYELARQVLADGRFSSRAEGKRVVRPRPGAEPYFGQPSEPGWFLDLDPPEHSRYRSLLAGSFTKHRMNTLRPRVQTIVEQCLDGLEAGGSPADLVPAFTLAVPLRAICELFGVPRDLWARFQRHSATVFSLTASAEQAAAAMAAMADMFAPLIAERRVRPADDLLTVLARSELTDTEAIGAATLLITAGHETVASMLALGTLVLLRDPSAARAVRAGTVPLPELVEELLRYLSILHFGVSRGALVDVELDGQLIRAGDTVTVALPAANRDPARFCAPDELSLTRPARGHLSFGFGLHQCIGANLARLELQVAYPALLGRFPELRLAVPAEDIAISRNGAVYALPALMVRW